MSVLALGDRARCGVLTCETLIAKNDPGGDPHKITGDLEVTGDLKIDGGATIEQAGLKGLTLNSNPSVNQVTIALNDNTQTWDINANSQFSTLFIDHTTNGAGSGTSVASFSKTAGGFGCQLPANPLQLSLIPTSATGLPSGCVWSNGGVLNITP